MRECENLHQSCASTTHSPSQMFTLQRLWSGLWPSSAKPPCDEPPCDIRLTFRDQLIRDLLLCSPQRHWDLYLLASLLPPGEIFTEGGDRVGCTAHVALPGTYEFVVCSGHTRAHSFSASCPQHSCWKQVVADLH